MSTDKEIFKGKSLSDLFSEIYDNSKQTRGQIKGLIGELKPLIQEIGDATLIVKEKGGDGEMFDFESLQELLEESEETKKEIEVKKEETEEDE